VLLLSHSGARVVLERQYHPTSREMVRATVAAADIARYRGERAGDAARRAAELEAVLVRRALRALVRHEGVSDTAAVAASVAAVDAAAKPRRARGLAKALVALAVLALVKPLRDVVRTVTRRHRVRVFTYHRVSALSRDPLTISPSLFAEQLDYIAQTHDVVPFTECLQLIRSGARLSRPVAAITFDDGYRSVYDFAFPAMRARGMTGTCFVSTALVGSEDRFPHDAESPVRAHLEVMDWDALQRLRAEGWVIGAHAETHARLSTCQTEHLERELAAPLAALKEHAMCDAAGVALAYPFGQPHDISEDARLRARAHGYSACLSNCGGENVPGDDPFTLRRIDLGSALPALVWRARVHGLELRSLLTRRSARL
jgi:peptidoglycan/xylan/chitin deacetylase (PgdA/CDA1 family)